MRKDRMGTLKQGNGDELSCSRGTMWPPIEAIIYGGAIEARPRISEQKYNEIRVWEQACGLRAMSPEKCPSCPYVNVNGELAVKPGGKGPKPQTVKSTKVASKMVNRTKGSS